MIEFDAGKALSAIEALKQSGNSFGIRAETLDAILAPQRAKVQREIEVAQATSRTVQELERVQKLLTDSTSELQGIQIALLEANSQMQASTAQSVVALADIQKALENSTKSLIDAQNRPPIIKWVIIGLIGGSLSGTIATVIAQVILKQIGWI